MHQQPGMGTATPTTTTPEQHRDRLLEILKDSTTVMLLSHGEGHRIMGRPMRLVRTDDDATLYLVTSVDTQKVDELGRDPRVSISVQNRDAIAIVDGEARVSQDRSLIDELWTDAWKTWFPDGKSDTSIAILVISPTEGTYWEQGFGHGLSYMFRMLKARITGEPVEFNSDDNAKVRLS